MGKKKLNVSANQQVILNFLRNAPAKLWECAQEARQRFWRNKIFMRGIIEFSNYCCQNCLYCGLRKDNHELGRYRLKREQILQQAAIIKELGIGTVVLQSGEDASISREFVSDLVSAIKNGLGLAVTLSVGERDKADLKAWRQAGADRYLLKMETFDPDLYGRLRPGADMAERLDQIKTMQDMGYESGSGIISGIQDMDRLAEDVDRLLQLQLDMISIGPFIPHPQTPLKDWPAGDPEVNLRALAVLRIHAPQAHIPVTSALALYGDAIKNRALSMAANVIMPSLTPEEVRGAYQIYPGKNMSETTPGLRAWLMRERLMEQGFELPDGPGRAWRLDN